MRQSERARRLAWAVAGLALTAAVAGCGSAMPSQPDAISPDGPVANVSSSMRVQGWPLPALDGVFLGPGEALASAVLGDALWGHPFAAGYGYPLILPQSSLYVGSGIELFAGTWPWRSTLYWGG